MWDRSKSTDLPVLLPAAERLASQQQRNSLLGYGLMRPSGRQLIFMGLFFLTICGVAQAQVEGGREGVLAVLIKWTPYLFEGFLFNILISVLAMAIGTVLGAILGLFQISLLLPVRKGAWFATQFFRNAPWLSLLFFTMFMLPFELDLGATVVPFPDWIKAVIGLSLPVMANISEIVRGAVISIPHGQWEAAESLSFSRRQQLWQIILPQCITRMIPPWMNWYSLLTMATVLASIVGVNEVMTRVSEVSAAEGGRVDLIAPLYLYVMLWFFIFTYPIARITIRLERKYAVKN